MLLGLISFYKKTAPHTDGITAVNVPFCPEFYALLAKDPYIDSQLALELQSFGLQSII